MFSRAAFLTSLFHALLQGWFGEERNIEEILAKKGVHVPVLDANGEYAPPDVGDGGGGGGTVDRKEAPKAD